MSLKLTLLTNFVVQLSETYCLLNILYYIILYNIYIYIYIYIDVRGFVESLTSTD